MSAVLRVEGLKKSFRSRTTLKVNEALRGVSFEVQRGRVTGFLGSNGAGKTTTLKCLLGLIFPDQGSIDFFSGEKNFEEIKRKIGFLPERPYFYEYLSGREYLKFCGQLMGLSTGVALQSRIDELLELVELKAAGDRALREYSKGMLQRIGIAQALIHKPEFVILDEPMSGLDPDGRYNVNQILRETARQGTTLFFSSHLLNDAETLCEDLVILAKGTVVYTGPMETLLQRLQSGFNIRYRHQGGVVSKNVESEQLLQKQIDELRQQGAVILDVRADRPSLERAFVQISGGKL